MLAEQAGGKNAEKQRLHKTTEFRKVRERLANLQWCPSPHHRRYILQGVKGKCAHISRTFTELIAQQ